MSTLTRSATWNGTEQKVAVVNSLERVLWRVRQQCLVGLPEEPIQTPLQNSVAQQSSVTPSQSLDTPASDIHGILSPSQGASGFDVHVAGTSDTLSAAVLHTQETQALLKPFENATSAILRAPGGVHSTSCFSLEESVDKLFQLGGIELGVRHGWEEPYQQEFTAMLEDHMGSEAWAQLVGSANIPEGFQLTQELPHSMPVPETDGTGQTPSAAPLESHLAVALDAQQDLFVRSQAPEPQTFDIQAHMEFAQSFNALTPESCSAFSGRSQTSGQQLYEQDAASQRSLQQPEAADWSSRNSERSPTPIGYADTSGSQSTDNSEDRSTTPTQWSQADDSEMSDGTQTVIDENEAEEEQQVRISLEAFQASQVSTPRLLFTEREQTPDAWRDPSPYPRQFTGRETAQTPEALSQCTSPERAGSEEFEWENYPQAQSLYGWCDDYAGTGLGPLDYDSEHDYENYPQAHPHYKRDDN